MLGIESRFQRWRFSWVIGFLGRCPRLALNCAPLALNVQNSLYWIRANAHVDIPRTRLIYSLL